ncbi:unnamed protein product [Arctia plantaginis]|uniref:Uncharacterized protein n=1 Tax=Arctia plantaginis TaxID=874455 RepID=A0A8S1AFL5_ARCPL|nr:unnamed protein product [Arctia plantaginis]CAB3244634.1 unnamed protein product [Arctia plantaginis]
MNTTETAEGSSCKGQENGDASNESERPLKKARFAWQVKGKYHLKNDANDTVKASSTTSPDPDTALPSGSGSSSSNRDTEQKLEIFGDYLMKQDFQTLDCVISAPDESLTPSTSIPVNERLPYPRYMSSYEQNMPNSVFKKNSESSNITKTLPSSVVVAPSFTEDQCIARWQIIQMVRGFIDNTINRVLDLELQPPLPPEDGRFYYVARDVADFINNLPGDNSIENEGILMAISAHGLQHPRNSYSNIHIENSNRNRVPDDADNIHLLTPLPSDDESHEPVNNINECDTDTSSNDLDMSWSYDDQKNENSDMTVFPLFPDSTNLSYQSVNESPQNSSTECEVIENPVDNHCDFVDEAILFAIQSKGLTTFGSDYG